MIAEILILGALPALLTAAAGWDLASFTIPNFLSLALIALFGVFAISVGLSWHAAGWHLLAGLLGLCIGFVLFSLRYIGGGDAKLFAAVALWMGFSDLLPYALLASVFGGVLTLSLLVVRRWPLPSMLLGYRWIVNLHDSRSGIPYGVALAAGAVVLLNHTEIFRLAASA